MTIWNRLARMPWRRVFAGVGLIGLFGIVRMPVEQGMEEELRAAGFREWSPDISSRDQLGQAGFAGALGGFRSLVALYFDVKAHSARQNKDWVEVEKFRNVTTTLQPRFWKHWDMAAWDMAWNAYAFYRREAERHRDDLEGWKIEKVTMPLYLEKGVDFARRGAKWLPDSYRLLRVVAEIYSQKYEDKCAAADWYLMASQAPDAPAYVYRAYAHHLALCEGSEEKAYEVTSALYHGGGKRTPTLRYDMEALEDHFAGAAARGKTLAELEAAAAAPGAGYRDLAALAMHLLEVAGDLSAATAAYGRLARDPEAPAFYRRKWAFLLARDPERAPAAYRALKGLYVADPDAFRQGDLRQLAELEEELSILPGERFSAPR